MILRKFILKIFLFAIIFIGVYYFFVDKLSRGYVDEYYNKFTQEAGGLIIGLSRANEGISPYILEEELKDHINFNKPIINFAINEAHFGEVYYKGIKKKITKSTNGIFIISITPGNFMAPSNLKDNQIFQFDKNLKMGKTSNFTTYPNYSYIINTYGLPLYNSVHQLDSWSHRISHSNGWNEIRLNVPNDTITYNLTKYWKSESIKFYTKKAKTEQITNYRYKYFIKILEYLTTKGNVFLIRIPSDLDILKLENNHWKNFDTEMDSISSIYNIPYFNYSKQSNRYKTYDGSHLESESAKKFSKILSSDIKTFLLKKKINEE